LAVVVLAVVGGILVLVALGGILWWAQRSPHRSPGESSPPPLVFLPVSAGLPADHAPPRRTPDATPAVSYAPPPPPRVEEEDDVEPLVLSMEEREVAEGGTAWRRRDRARVLRAEGAEPPSALTGTLRMLPGRLEVVAGLPVRSEIRFVQTGGGPEQQVTLGRQEGRPYEHVQLASQTVSRLHAAMTYSRGRWRVANLSETNPLRVNGAAVAREAPPVELADGDTVELGEVVLRFRI